jgi:hypothetical protein
MPQLQCKLVGLTTFQIESESKSQRADSEGNDEESESAEESEFVPSDESETS